MSLALRDLRCIALALLTTLAASGCKRTPTTPLPTAPPPLTGPAAARPDRTLGSDEVLGTLRWRGSRWFEACGGRHVGDRPAREEGCRTAPIPEPGVEPLLPDTNRAPPTQGAGQPPSPCRVVLEWAPGDPGSPPARALIEGPRERALVASWSPPPEVDGDRFVIEVSFSPDGRWIGIARESIGVGDSDMLVRVEQVEVKPAPRCR